MRLLKRVMLIFLILSVCLILYIIVAIRDIETGLTYGNYVRFHNKLEMTIDSIQISVCETKTMCRTSKEDTISKNISTPKDGYPCPVEITVYTTDTVITLQSDKKFDCLGCDIAHDFKLTKSGAIYTIDDYLITE